MPSGRIGGLAVTRLGYGRPSRFVRVVEAGHPVPDAAGLAATAETLALADSAGRDDLVLVLVSGGASANWIAPAAGLSLAEKQAVTRALLASGASIVEINTVRKHLSRIKGGRLAQRASPAPLVAIGISDVPGDDPAVIGSGPTVPDPSTLADARAIVARYRLEVPPQLPATPISPELRHNMFLAAKESVNNIVKHARAQSAWLRLNLQPNRFILEIADDGRGLSPGDREKGRSGLRNLEKRMADIGGTFEITAREEGGTIVRLAAPLDTEIRAER